MKTSEQQYGPMDIGVNFIVIFDSDIAAVEITVFMRTCTIPPPRVEAQNKLYPKMVDRSL